MKFGKSLSEKVRDDWKEYAVDYKGMKRVLPEKDLSYFPPNDADKDAGANAPFDVNDENAEVPLDGGTQVSLQEQQQNGSDSDEHKPNDPIAMHPQYWELYKKSLVAITTFHTEKQQWASHRSSILRSRVDDYRLEQKEKESSGEDSKLSSTGQELREQITAFKIEVEFIKEFLSINFTAFSKILKKYDKRTFSLLREVKLKEILRNYSFFDGTALDEFLVMAETMLKDMDDIDDIVREVDEDAEGIVQLCIPATMPGISDKHSVAMFRSSRGFKSNQKLKAIDKTIRPYAAPKTETQPPQPSDASATRQNDKIYETTRGILERIEQSPFFRKFPIKHNPTFKAKEIQMGNLLGEGEFSIVREVTAFKIKELCPICVIHQFKETSDHKNERSTTMGAGAETSKSGDQMTGANTKVNARREENKKIGGFRRAGRQFEISMKSESVSTMDADNESFQDDHEEEANEEVANRGFMKHHCFRDGSARYAIKQLKSTLDAGKRTDGAIDLAIEAKFLSVLSHPNIIKLCGTSRTKGDPNAFIILDRLYGTLHDKIASWKEIDKECVGFLGVKKKGAKSKKQILWSDRLLAGFDIARALKYLHNHDIIYRDLKPENVGFDVRGNAKIFDFGLAKALTEQDKIAKDQYEASGRTGTRRYMAPEVVLCKFYGKPVDVFSFAIVFWEMLSLSLPFKGFDHEKHARLVVKKKKRPDLKEKWPILIKDVLNRSWDDDPSKRPNFSQICNLLDGEFMDHSGGLSRTERLQRMDQSEHNFSMMMRTGIN